MRTELRFGLLGTALLVTACAPPPAPGAQGGDATAKASGPEQACKRASELATADGEPADAAAKLESDCLARMNELKEVYGTAISCMEGAADLRQLKACELPITSYQSMFAALSPSPEALCDHVVTMMMNELGDQVPQDQLPMIRDKCVDDARRNAEVQGESFAAQARCVMGKNTIAELRECENLAGPGAGAGGPRPAGPPPGAPPSAAPPVEPSAGSPAAPPPGAPQVQPPAGAQTPPPAADAQPSAEPPAP